MAQASGQKRFYQTNEAARLIGVSRPTLLRWFREKRVVDVERDRRGWRRFSDEDIRRLREFHEQSPSVEESGS